MNQNQIMINKEEEHMYIYVPPLCVNPIAEEMFKS